MNIELKNIITNWIPNESKVIDFGCGDGALLKEFRDKKNTVGYGIEIDTDGMIQCLKNDIEVVEKNIDDGSDEFAECNFDSAIMEQEQEHHFSPNVNTGVIKLYELMKNINTKQDIIIEMLKIKLKNIQ